MMHTKHSVPQFRNTLNMLSSSPSSAPNLKSPLSTINTLTCSCCHNRLCTNQPVPSQREVENALSAALQQFMQAFQQISGSYDPRIVMSQSYKRFYDAFQLLQADPAMKRLVVSLSSDKALWDAVMHHVLHQKLLELPDSVECRRPKISEVNELGIRILSWALDTIKGKILELIESFHSLVNDLFQSPRMENAQANVAELNEKVKSSLVLSIVILLIVAVARSKRF